MNPLLEALGDTGYILDTPGAYLRGALAGRLGERSSGEELLNSYGFEGGPFGGAATEVLLDPLAMPGLALGAVKGFHGINRATRGLAGLAASEEANPLLRRLAMLGDETGASRLSFGDAQDLLQRSGHETPLGWLDRMAGSAGVKVQAPADPEHWASMFNNPSDPGIKQTVAMYRPREQVVVPNIYDYPRQWSELDAMIGDFANPAYPAAHEIGHALHDVDLRIVAPQHGPFAAQALRKVAETRPEWLRARDRIAQEYGRNARTSPTEFVADYFAKDLYSKATPDRASIMAHELGLPGPRMYGNFPHDPRLTDVYSMLFGPAAPHDLIDALRQLRIKSPMD